MAGLGLTDNSGDLNGVGVNTDHEMFVSPTQDFEKAGQVLVGAESNADGDGIGRYVKPMEVSADFRLRTAVDSTLFADNFSHAQVNVSKYKVVNTTATNALSGGRWILNSGNSVTAGQGTQVQTWAKFGLTLSASLYADFVASIAQPAQVNNVIELGLFQCSGVTAPTDGVLFRLNASGVLEGAVNINGSETSTPLISTTATPFVMVPTRNYHFLLALHNDRVDFWIDDVLVGKIITPNLFGAPFLTMQAPLTMRIYNSNTVSLAQQLQIANISVTQGDVNSNRLWTTAQAVMGNSCLNVPDGTAAGQTANYANSAAPALTAIVAQTNLVACYPTLGGQFNIVAMAGAETDLMMFAYLNPAMSPTVPGKNLVVRGITIDSINLGAAVAVTASIIQWGVGVGQTAVTNATVDSATAGTRASRRATLGIQCWPIGAAIGAQANKIDINLDAPLVCEPGCYFIVYYKFISGTATVNQAIRGTCFINGYFE